MIRSRVEEEDPEDVGEEEEEEEENEAAIARHEGPTGAPRGAGGGGAGAGGPPPLVRADSFTVQTQVQPVALAPPRRVMPRRSSSVEHNYQPLKMEARRVTGGDSSLRPNFLKERSATLVDLVSEPAGEMRVPQSKASAFLLSVLAKARGSSTFESKRAALEPLRGGTNSLRYVTPERKEHGVPLRASGRHSRRQGRTISGIPPKGMDALDILPGEDDPEAGRKGAVALVRDLQYHRQQLSQQLGALQSIMCFVNAEGANGGEMELYKEMVDEGLITELAAAMREFRFHTGLQVCVVSILSVLADASVRYAYMMSEMDLDKLLAKTAAVHSSQERLVLLASTVVHAIEESKVKFNVQAYRAEKSAKVRQQSVLYAKEVAAQIASKSKQSGPKTRRPSRSSSDMVADELAERLVVNNVPTPRSKRKGERSQRPHALAHSANRIRQAFAADVSPPVLGTNYRLHFAQRIKKTEVPPLPRVLTSPQGDRDSELIGYTPRLQRPATSPAKTQLRLELSSDSLAAAAYLGAPVFVEPSPLSKRLPHRGSFSAGGIRRKLGSQKKAVRANTAWLMPPELLDSRSPTTASAPDLEPLATAKLQRPDSDETGVISANQEEDLQSESDGSTQAETTFIGREEDPRSRPGEDTEDEDESYEDDFDVGDETEDEQKSIVHVGNRMLGSDGELIDMLHDISVKDSAAAAELSIESLPMIPVLSESQAAISIQRHIRGRLARRGLQLQSQSTANEPTKQKSGAPMNVGNQKRNKTERRTRREVQGYRSRTPSVRSHRLERSVASRNQRVRPSTSAGVSRVTGRVPIQQSAPSPVKKRISSARDGHTKLRAQDQRESKSYQTRKPPELSKEKTSKEGSADSADKETRPESEGRPEEEELQVQELPGPEALKKIQDLYAEGLQHHKENHLGLAIDCYEAALNVSAAGERQFASLHVNLGSALMTQHKFPQALDAFEQAKRIQPDNIKATYNCALALLNLARPKEAMRQLQRVLELEPAHEKAKFALSHLGANAASSPCTSLSSGQKLKP